MKKRSIAVLLMLVMSCTLMGGCGNKDDISLSDTKKVVSSNTENESVLEDGVYTAEFTTDNSMFHVSEACDGKGTLTVKDGEMSIHISLTSKNIVNLFLGLAEDAKKEGAELLQPTVDTVAYSDGTSEEVNGFDVPVPAIDEEFDLALIGTKGKWYDHKVKVTNPVPYDENADEDSQSMDIADGNYEIELDFEGGSGKASVSSPTNISVEQGKITATITWSSPNYDYMLVNEEKYLPINTEGNSVFEIPVEKLDEPIKVIGDTVAMSKPHEIEYTLTFHSDSMKKVQ